ncbi:MAG: glycosyltransferase family 2 protein [Stenotrophobium sp.]
MSTTPEVSLVIPCHNESAGLAGLFVTLIPIISAATHSFEIVVVNDGSADDTLVRLLEWQQSILQLRVIDLSRNFGKEAAVAAGLQHCRGRCAILLDADLQDPPELIPQMLARWHGGYESVVAVHSLRGSDSLWRRTLTKGFYRLLNAVSDTAMTENMGDFRLLDRAVIDAFLALPERTRFNKGLFAWIGFRQCRIEHERPARTSGASKFTYRRLFGLAIEGITSFSSTPLRISTYAGGVISLLSFLYGSYILLRTLIYGNPVPGYASIFVAVMFFGGINLLSISVLGEYVGKIFVESKQRPLYVVRRAHEPAEVSKDSA